MNLTVFGASGGIGSHVTAMAAERGHTVRAVYRTPPDAPPPGRAEALIAPNIFDPGFVAEAIRGAHGVIAALGPNFTVRHNPRTAMTSPPDLHYKAARALIAGTRHSAPQARLICVSTGSMGPADNLMGPGTRMLFRFLRTVAVPNLGRVGQDLGAMETELAASGLDWYAVRAVKLTDGPLTRNVQSGDRFRLKPISRADVAWHMLDLVEHPAPGPQRTPLVTTGNSRTTRTTTGSTNSYTPPPTSR